MPRRPHIGPGVSGGSPARTVSVSMNIRIATVPCFAIRIVMLTNNARHPQPQPAVWVEEPGRECSLTPTLRGMIWVKCPSWVITSLSQQKEFAPLQEPPPSLAIAAYLARVQVPSSLGSKIQPCLHGSPLCPVVPPP